MWDNFVVGGIGYGFDVCGVLEKECWEEVGIGIELVVFLVLCGMQDVLCEVFEGIQCEMFFVFDLMLLVSFVFVNQDGEVVGYLCVSFDVVFDIMVDFVMMVDVMFVIFDVLVCLGLLYVLQWFVFDNNI